MKTSRAEGRLLPVLLSLALAMFLTILPMPTGFDDFRPQWVVLTVIFWGLRQPERVGVFWAFGTGLLLDVLSGSLLGQQALGLSLVAYAVALLYARIRLFPPWQQAFFIWLLLLVERLFTLWVLGATGQPLPGLSYWDSSFIGLLIWPWLSRALTSLDRRMGTR
jgi:rod shape-determining protein MreD